MKNVKITRKEDGVYLSIGVINPEDNISRKDIITLIDSYNVQDVDFVLLNEQLKGNISNLELKISDKSHIYQVDEKVDVDVSTDRMEAFVIFQAPINEGNRLDAQGIIAVLEAEGILNYNIEIINTLVLHKVYERKYSVAKGVTPINGTDGYLQYHFNNENLKPKPKILEDGSVDFRQLGTLRLCERGDVLVTSVPPRAGVDGRDVTGNILPYTEGRAPQPIPVGKNTYVSEDGMHLIADVSGQIAIQQGKIHISPCLEIRENVDNSTGNIDFNGQVVVNGNVLTGFTVRAQGSIEIHGVCEGATIQTDGDIVIGRGAQGMERAKLKAGGSITAKFIEGCSVSAEGNITADSIMNSTINCGGDVILSGKRGLLTGGKLIAGQKLMAKTIGSPMGTTTIIEVGNNPTAILELKSLKEEYDNLRKDFEKVDQGVSVLTAQQKKGTLTEDKKQILVKMLNAKMTYRERLNKLQLKIDEMSQSIMSNAGTVSASNVIQPGVRITIGNAHMAVRDKMSRCTLRNNGEKIALGPFAG
ncbi:MAG: FapA family protein [Defluviitaleaceae bacterium]|nr:FapA family protein [Defluviitaleaceae bacterium]